MTTTILCYGDSNTWGYVPGMAQRYPRAQRWPGVLAAALGAEVAVIEEGLNSRTTVFDDPCKVGKNGLAYFRPCLDTHAPLDLLVLMLGTNDLKHRFGLSAADVAANVAALLNVLPQAACGVGGTTPRAVLVSPPLIGPLTALTDVFEGAAEKAKHLARHYRAVAELNRCRFVDAGEVPVSPIDGVHLDGEGHARLGRLMAEAVRAALA